MGRGATASRPFETGNWKSSGLSYVSSDTYVAPRTDATQWRPYLGSLRLTGREIRKRVGNPLTLLAAKLREDRDAQYFRSE